MIVRWHPAVTCSHALRVHFERWSAARMPASSGVRLRRRVFTSLPSEHSPGAMKPSLAVVEKVDVR